VCSLRGSSHGGCRRTWVAGDLVFVRGQRTLGKNLEDRCMVSNFGGMAGAGACLATDRKEVFENPVFDRMKTHHHQPPARLENPLGRPQRRKQLAKLTVYKNAQGLEPARRTMHIARPVTWHATHDMCKVMCGSNCLIGARIHNGTG